MAELKNIPSFDTFTNEGFGSGDDYMVIVNDIKHGDFTKKIFYLKGIELEDIIAQLIDMNIINDSIVDAVGMTDHNAYGYAYDDKGLLIQMIKMALITASSGRGILRH